MKIKKFNESETSGVNKAKKETLTYYHLFDLLKGLEKERPGIKDRVWKWMCEDKHDVAFSPYNGRISYINLFYYGAGDEYTIKSLERGEVEHSKKIHPKAFISGTKEEQFRLDLNLIWSTYDEELNDETSMLHSSVEMFAVLVSW